MCICFDDESKGVRCEKGVLTSWAEGGKDFLNLFSYPPDNDNQ